MSSVALTAFLASVNCTYFPLLILVGQPLVGASTAPAGKVQHQWVSNGEELVKELLDLASNAPEMDEPDLSEYSDVIRAVASSIAGQRLANLKKADRILWKLWLTTGMAPVVRGEDRPLRNWLEENTVAYRQYVTKHADLTEEQLQRMGIANTVGSLGSPLWYMTIRYLREKAGVEFTRTFVIDVVPHHFMIESPLTPESYTSLANAMSRWLDMNNKRMLWDSGKGRFRPQDGTYLGTEELSDAIANAFANTFPAGQEQRTKPQEDVSADTSDAK